jgi:hypothetical protein
MYAFQQRVELFNFATIIIKSDVTHSMTKLIQFFQDFKSDRFIVINRVISY